MLSTVHTSVYLKILFPWYLFTVCLSWHVLNMCCMFVMSVAILEIYMYIYLHMLALVSFLIFFSFFVQHASLRCWVQDFLKIYIIVQSFWALNKWTFSLPFLCFVPQLLTGSEDEVSLNAHACKIMLDYTNPDADILKGLVWLQKHSLHAPLPKPALSAQRLHSTAFGRKRASKREMFA